VITPDINTLTCIIKNDIKYFELIAEPVKQELLPNLFINAWGYNGSTPGPTILVYPGDTVNIRVYNNLPDPTSVHWHGLDIPNNMDGVPDVEPTPKIQPGSYFDYRFKIVNPPGTHMYHTHVNSSHQEMMGLCGGFIILDPMQKSTIDYDYFIMLQEFHLKGLEMGEIRPGLYDIEPIAHDFNFFTMNGRSFPFTTSMTTSLNSIIRIRLGNISMNAHPIHLHGHQFLVIASDGNSMSYNNYLLKNTIHVAPGETWDVMFKSDNPGIWPFHCHIPHHMSNNMTKSTGGMFTTIKY
jgi:FtsP/CotA-like multicopper oxidase with cupredoxin domain